MPLSPFHFRQIADGLMACTVESALRQVEMHRANGDFSADDCDRLAEFVQLPHARQIVTTIEGR